MLNYCNGKYILRQKRRRLRKGTERNKKPNSHKKISITELAKLHAKFQLRTSNLADRFT